MTTGSVGLISPRDVEFVTRRWIGVTGGYLGDFSYRTHHEFYPDYCDIEDIEPYRIEGTTRQRFETIFCARHQLAKHGSSVAY